MTVHLIKKKKAGITVTVHLVKKKKAGFPRLTNEVQHPDKVLRWNYGDRITVTVHLIKKKKAGFQLSLE